MKNKVKKIFKKVIKWKNTRAIPKYKLQVEI